MKNKFNTLKAKINAYGRENDVPENIKQALKNGEDTIKSIDSTQASVSVMAMNGMNIPEGNPYEQDREILKGCISVLSEYEATVLKDEDFYYRVDVYTSSNILAVVRNTTSLIVRGHQNRNSKFFKVLKEAETFCKDINELLDTKRKLDSRFSNKYHDWYHPRSKEQRAKEVAFFAKIFTHYSISDLEEIYKTEDQQYKNEEW